MKPAFLLLFVLSILTISAQTTDFIDVKWSSRLNIDPDLSFDRIVYESESDGVFVLFNDKKDFLLRHYSKDLSLKNELELTNIENKDLMFHDIFMFNKQMVLITATKEKSTKKSLLFYSLIDMPNLKIVEELNQFNEISFKDTASKAGVKTKYYLKKGFKSLVKVSPVNAPGQIHSLDYKNLIGVENNTLKPDQCFKSVSPGESKLLLYNMQFNMDPKVPSTIQFDLFDKEMKSESHASFNVVVDFSPKLVTVNDIGQIFIVGYLENKTVITKYDSSGSLLDKHELELADFDIVDRKIEVVKNDLLLAGIFSIDEDNYCDGLFFQKFDLAEFKASQFGQLKFDNQFHVKSFKEKKQKRILSKIKKDGIVKKRERGYKLDKVILHKDGNITLIAEKLYSESSFSSGGAPVTTTSRNPGTGNVTSTTSNPGSSTSIKYFADDIVVARLNSEGDFQWVKVIPKSQSATPTMLWETEWIYSYGLIYNNSEMFFLFHDVKNNLDPGLKQNQIETTFFALNAVPDINIVKIDAEGNLKKKKFSSKKQEWINFVPRKVFSADKDKVHIFSIVDNELQIGEVIVN